MSTLEMSTVEWEHPDPEQGKLEPGAMMRCLTREIASGRILFEESPAGWLTKGRGASNPPAPRKVPWRAYFYLHPEHGKIRLPSTTGILDLICPKGGLPYWSEARGIEGLYLAVKQGKIDLAAVTAEEAIDRVRELGLGADGAKNRAADRGLNVHALLERYMLTGEAPKLGEHPEHHRGFIVGLTNWLLEADPEPVAVEQLVVSPDDGYAGRLDLRARIGGVLTTVDLKTQENAGIYPAAHYQVAMYERAAIACGEDPADQKMVVVVAANGKHRAMAADHDEWQLDAALSHWRGKRPLDSMCESLNRAEKLARTDV